MIILKRKEHSVEIKDLGRLQVACIATGDPVTDPKAIQFPLLIISEKEYWELREQHENNNKEPVLAMPVYVAEFPGSVALWPTCDKTYYFKAWYYPPVKETP